MLRTSLRNVLAHKARLLMTTLAVLLGVAFVAGTLIFTSSLSEALRASSEKGLDAVDLAVEPPPAPGRDDAPAQAERLDQQVLDQIAALPGVASATGAVEGMVPLADKDGKLVGDGWSSLGRNYDAGADGTAADPRYPFTDGRAPQREDEIALDSHTAERTGYRVGDTARLSVDGLVREPVVTGVFDTDDGRVAAGGTLVLFDTATAQRLFAEPGRYDRILVTAEAGTSQDALQAATQEILPAGATAVTGERLAADEADEIESAMSGFRTAMLGFAGVSLFVGVFIIANTFSMLVAQRTRELALLRAIGASRRQVTRSVLTEALVVGLVAGAAGLLAGVGIAVGLRALLSGVATIPSGPLVVSAGTVLASLLVGVGVTLVSSYLPARRAARIPPVAAMNSVHARATGRSLVVRNTIGSLLAAAGAVMVLVGIDLDDQGLTMGLGGATLVVGVFVLTPLLSRPLIGLARPLLSGFGVAGRLARLNAVRNRRRTAATAAALMIGLALITGMTVLAGSVQKGVDEMAAGSLRADYVVSMADFGDLAPQVADTLAEQPGVTAVSGIAESPAEVGQDGSTEWLTGVDGAAIGELTSLEFTAGSFEGLRGERAVVDEESAAANGWELGDRVPVVFEDGTAGELRLSGVYQGNEMINGLMLDAGTLDPHRSEKTDFQVMVKLAEGPSQEARAALEAALGQNPAIRVQDREDISEEIARMFTMMLNIVYGLLAMAVIVAVLGVVNTLAMSVFERRQEIGMLRAIGLDRQGTKRMVRLESLVIALFGGLLGIGLGVFFGWAVGEVVSRSLSTYELVLPWDRMGVFLALAAVVGIVAALWPARRAARLNMLEAIKAD